MRAFDLIRIEDVTGISGTGRVAEGVVFDDGHVVMRWLTAHRSTTFFPDIETVRIIHSHAGKTQIVFRDENGLVEIPKPHLALGNEGKYADGSQYDQGGAGPVLPGAREAYDRLGKIEAPVGWSAHACFEIGGEACLLLRGPSTYLRAEEYEYEGEKHTRTIYRRLDAVVIIQPDGRMREATPRNNPSEVVLRVHGVPVRTQCIEYWT
jgi:hypothetical protein